MNSKQCPFCKKWIPLPIREADRFFNRHKKECDPAGYKRQTEFAIREGFIGGPEEDMEDIVVVEEGEEGAEAAPKTAKAPKAPKTPKAEKPAPTPKAPKEPKPSKFPGTYTQADAIRVVDAAVAAEKPLGKSRSFSVPVNGHTVAPKWLVTEITGVQPSEFRTADAVEFLATLGLVASKGE